MLGLGLGLRSTGQSLQQKAMSILRSFGSNASSYPFSTRQGAYQTSTGPAAAAVNDPIGLELDAMGAVGPEVVVNPTFLSGGAGWLVAYWALSTGAATATSVAGGNLVYQLGVATSGNVYRVNYTVDSISAGGVAAYINGTQGTIRTAPGAYTETLQAAAINTFVGAITVGTTTAVISSFSCVQVTGNHATQTTAGDRPLLAQDAGGRWYANTTGGKSLTVTFPPGYESATTIDSTSAGQVTLTAQNLVGTYTINTDTYDRIVIRDSASVSAGQLTILQQYADSLAGL